MTTACATGVSELTLKKVIRSEKITNFVMVRFIAVPSGYYLAAYSTASDVSLV